MIKPWFVTDTWFFMMTSVKRYNDQQFAKPFGVFWACPQPARVENLKLAIAIPCNLLASANKFYQGAMLFTG